MCDYVTADEAAALDKYYTKVSVAKACYELYKPFLPEDALLIEPSAGDGAFLKAIGQNILGFDLLPEGEGIVANDFLVGDLRTLLTPEQRARNIAIIGNPPFGKKAVLAIEFLNKSLNMFGLVGFIIPVQFRKWSVQSKINPFARLLLDETLGAESFEFMGKPYKVRCCFQVWTLDQSGEENIRLASKPPVAHADFDMWQFNRTVEAEKFFDYDWDFAVPRQGYQDYTFKALKKENCDRKKQWIFFKAHSPEALARLKALDYVKLSEKNTGIPGFGKADLIEAYESYCDSEG